MFQAVPLPADVRQGGISNCGMMSALNSILVRPDGPSVIQGMVKDNHDHVIFRLSVGVKIKVGGEEKVGVESLYKVTKSLPTESIFHRGPARHSLGAKWVRLFEKALIGLHFPTEGYRKYAVGGGDPSAIMASLLGGAEDTAPSIRSTSQDFQKFSDLIAYSKDSVLQPPRVVEVSLMGSAEQRALQLKKATNRHGQLVEAYEEKKNQLLAAFAPLNAGQLEQWKNWNVGETNKRLVNTRVPPYSTRFDRVLDDAPNHMTFKDVLLHWYRTHIPVPGALGKDPYTAAQIDLFQSMKRGLLAQRIITVETKANLFGPVSGIGNNSQEQKVLGLVAQHWYAVVEVKSLGTRHFIKVRNPWGKYHREYTERAGVLHPRAVAGGADSLLELTDFFLNFEPHFYEGEPVRAMPSGQRRGAVFGGL